LPVLPKGVRVVSICDTSLAPDDITDLGGEVQLAERAIGVSDRSTVILIGK
jgi:hypothetical protein